MPCKHELAITILPNHGFKTFFYQHWVIHSRNWPLFMSEKVLGLLKDKEDTQLRTWLTSGEQSLKNITSIGGLAGEHPISPAICTHRACLIVFFIQWMNPCNTPFRSTKWMVYTPDPSWCIREVYVCIVAPKCLRNKRIWSLWQKIVCLSGE